MNNTFKLLAEFLDRFEGEVEGRQFVAPPAEVQAKLRALARGSLPATEQQEIFLLLNQNTEWIADLAKEIKAMRPNPEKAR